MYGLGFPLDFCPGAGVEPTLRACSTIELSEYIRGGAAAPPGIERGLYFALGRYDLFASQLQRMDGKQYEYE